MKSLLLSVLLAAPLAAQETPAAHPVPAPLSAEQARHEATRVALALGYSDDATLEADPAKVAEIADALAAVRRLEPRLAGYTLRHMGPPDDTLLVGYERSLAPAMAAAYQAAGGGALRRPAALGVQALDRTTAALGGRYELMDSFGNLRLAVRFARALDLEKASARFTAIPGVSYAEPNRLIGGGGPPVSVASDGPGSWRVALHRGWGDCMAGCINNEYWYFTVRGGVAASAGHWAHIYDPKTNSYVELGTKAWDVRR